MWRPFLARARQNVSPYLSVIAWLPSIILVHENVGTLMTVTGKSMSPTLNPDTSKLYDVVYMDRWYPLTGGKFHRGDVVVLKSPINSRRIVKRIIALEGDVVQTLPPYPDAWVRVPDGHAWVEGDEPFHTRDSNQFGPVSLSLIDSKVNWIVFPFSRIGPVPPSPRAKATRERVMVRKRRSSSSPEYQRMEQWYSDNSRIA